MLHTITIKGNTDDCWAVHSDSWGSTLPQARQLSSRLMCLHRPYDARRKVTSQQLSFKAITSLRGGQKNAQADWRRCQEDRYVCWLTERPVRCEWRQTREDHVISVNSQARFSLDEINEKALDCRYARWKTNKLRPTATILRTALT